MVKKNAGFVKNGKGYVSRCIIPIPIEYARMLGITNEDREVEVSYKKNQIVIEKTKRIDNDE